MKELIKNAYNHKKEESILLLNAISTKNAPLCEIIEMIKNIDSCVLFKEICEKYREEKHTPIEDSEYYQEKAKKELEEFKNKKEENNLAFIKYLIEDCHYDVKWNYSYDIGGASVRFLRLAPKFGYSIYTNKCA